MDDWSADVPSCATLFSDPRPSPPPDCTVTTKTQDPSPIDLASSGANFHGLEALSIQDLELSHDHKLDWATKLLRQFGPRVSAANTPIWRIEAIAGSIPPEIKSEDDTMAYIRHSLLNPALAAAKFIRAQHLGISAADLVQYPCTIHITNCSSTGGSGRGDFAIERLRVPHDNRYRYAAVIETKRARVCHSNGKDLDGRGHNSVLVLKYLQDWLQRDGYIPMDQNGSPSERQNGAFDPYDQPWKRKIQKFLFQCWHAMFQRETHHGVLANEREFILLQRSNRGLRLSRLYSCRPSTPEETLEMMTHLSYFIAHALCERFPSKDNSFHPPDSLPAIRAVSDTASSSSSSASSSNTGTSRTHAKTDSQATIRGPVDATIMRLANCLVRFLNTGCTASSVTFNLMGPSSPPLAIRVVHEQTTGFSFAKQPCTISLSHAVQWGDRCHVFRGRFGGRAVVAKICSDRADRTKSPLLEEYTVYQALGDLQGSSIPRCYGLFRVGDFADMLLLEDCGESLQSYDGLTENQRASLLSHVSNIHRHNICHQDLEPRNIVMSTSGQLRVVDFELSDRFHQCAPQDCEELQELAWETKGGPLKDVSRRQRWLVPAMVAGVLTLMYYVCPGA